MTPETARPLGGQAPSIESGATSKVSDSPDPNHRVQDLGCYTHYAAIGSTVRPRHRDVSQVDELKRDAPCYLWKGA